jgi:hypothetical protein
MDFELNLGSYKIVVKKKKHTIMCIHRYASPGQPRAIPTDLRIESNKNVLEI